MTFRLLTIAAVAALFAACGSAGDDDGSGADKGSESDLKDRVEDFFEAFQDGPPKDAYAFYREECRDQYSLSEYTRTIVGAKALFEAFLGVKFDDLELDGVDFTT